MPPKTPRNGAPAVDNAVPETTDAVGIVLMLVFIAATSTLSLASMSPIYGSIPSSAHHGQAVAASVVLGFVLHYLRSGRRSKTVLRWLLSVPVLMASWHTFLRKGGDTLGPTYGPLVHGLYTCYPWVALTAYGAADAVFIFRSDPDSRLWVDYGLTAGVSMIIIFCLRVVLQSSLPKLFVLLYSAALPPWTAVDPVKISIVVLPLLVAFAGRDKRPGMWEVATIILLLAIVAPTTLPTESFATEGAAAHWKLLDKTWSNTGYISVLENTAENYRVLRCDHSLLGGEWLATDQRQKDQKWKTNEPIYHVFEMLEAVRLIKTEPKILDRDAKALVIGLGVGTAPKALIQHGIDTTVLELDPAVHAYATKYFDLPANHTPVLQDAIGWTTKAAHRTPATYDYIIHDVFTGGAEPLPLFTHAFISNLRRLLRPNGVAAINYAGELSLPLTRKIFYTIDSVFEGRCKAFADNDPAASESGFLNMVVFCRNSPGTIDFRKPMKADFLGSISRSHYLLPKAEHEVAIPGRKDDDKLGVFRDHEIGRWNSQQLESAIRHWKIMRKIVPPRVWTAY